MSVSLSHIKLSVLLSVYVKLWSLSWYVRYQCVSSSLPRCNSVYVSVSLCYTVSVSLFASYAVAYFEALPLLVFVLVIVFVFVVLVFVVIYAYVLF